MISQKKEAKSNFTAYLSIKDNEKINEKLIIPLVSKFFDNKEISNFKPLAENADISDKDLTSENFQDFFTYFYEYIVNDIHKNNGEIEVTVTYCITLDKKNCSKKCEETGIFYDKIFLYKQPVFYFIYINIKDIFEFLRN